MELVDLEVEKVDRAPKCGVVPISVHGLLIRFIGFVVFLARSRVAEAGTMSKSKGIIRAMALARCWHYDV